MAENLVKLMDSDGYRRLISIILSLKSAQEQEIEKCIKSYSLDMTIQKGEYIIYLPPNSDSYQLLMCEATHISNTTEPNMAYFKHIDSTQFESYTEEELLDMLNLSETELQNLQNILNDDEISTHTTHSSSKIYAELLTVLAESKNFTIAEVAKIVSFSYKVVSSEDDVIDDKAIYLIENASGTHDMYLLIDGSPSKVGNTSIDLSDYLKKENIVDTFDGTATYTDSDKVFSTKASKSMYDDLNDKKISKSNIVTTLDDTVTDEQIPSALATYNATKDKNLKTYTTIEGDTIAEAISNLPYGSILTMGVDSSTPFISDCPNSSGLFVVHKIRYDSVRCYFYGVYNYLCYTGNWNQGLGTQFSGWQKVCTTSVPDVPKTAITITDETNYKISNANHSWYSVENGWCEFSVYIQAVSPSTDIVYIDNVNLPLPKRMFINAYINTSNNDIVSKVVFRIEADGRIGFNNGVANHLYCFRGAYKVADDWQP